MQRGRGVRPGVFVLAMLAPAVLAAGLLVAELTGYEEQVRGRPRHVVKVKAASRWQEAPGASFLTPMPAPPHADSRYEGMVPALVLSGGASRRRLECERAGSEQSGRRRRVEVLRVRRCVRSVQWEGQARRVGGPAPLVSSEGGDRFRRSGSGARTWWGDGREREAKPRGRGADAPWDGRGTRTVGRTETAGATPITSGRASGIGSSVPGRSGEPAGAARLVGAPGLTEPGSGPASGPATGPDTGIGFVGWPRAGESSASLGLRRAGGSSRSVRSEGAEVGRCAGLKWISAAEPSTQASRAPLVIQGRSILVSDWAGGDASGCASATPASPGEAGADVLAERDLVSAGGVQVE